MPPEAVVARAAARLARGAVLASGCWSCSSLLLPAGVTALWLSGC